MPSNALLGISFSQSVQALLLGEGISEEILPDGPLPEPQSFPEASGLRFPLRVIADRMTQA